MPLPAPTCSRQPSHQRSIQVQTHVRSDGLFDIEGRLTDVWPEAVPIATGLLPAGQPMHEMWLRLTVDRTATIVAVAAATDAGPYGAACGTITPDYEQLVGVQIARGYRDAIRRLFARTAGCTHMTELANLMGAAAMQALWSVLTADPQTKPFSIDGCHALRSDGPQVQTFYPQWFKAAVAE